MFYYMQQSTNIPSKSVILRRKEMTGKCPQWFSSSNLGGTRKANLELHCRLLVYLGLIYLTVFLQFEETGICV